MISKLLKMWAKSIGRSNDLEIKRACGVKPYGIEYRIMLEGGAAQLDPKAVPDDVLDDIDLAWHRVARSYPNHMNAVKEYYKRGSYRAVRLALGCSQHSSKTLVREGEFMLKGALMILW